LIARGILVGNAPIQLINDAHTQQTEDILLNPRKSLTERGSEPSLFPQNPLLIDEILDVVCNAYTAAATDEAVHLQVLKVILTAVTGENSLVHGITLLKAIQACFLIHINSKNHINQTTAKASLTQMINVIFDRLENNSPVFLWL
jgi:brefeldin A-inhibited guanine nucleotide-exchange protein